MAAVATGYTGLNTGKGKGKGKSRKSSSKGYTLPPFLNAAPAGAAAAAAEEDIGLPGTISYIFLPDNRLVQEGNESKFILPNGKTLGKFVKARSFTHKLGHGMSGDTFLLDNFGAEKFVLKHITRTDKVPKYQIIQEIMFLAKVKGKKYAVQLLAAQINPDGTGYMLFPFVPGKTLYDLIVEYQETIAPKAGESAANRAVRNTSGAAQINVLKKAFNEILDGLKELHALGIVHRDIKPENIWVPEDPSIQAFMLDMGLAALMSGKIRTSGTRYYIRPSRLGLNRNPTPNDNYFALGMTSEYVVPFGKYGPSGAAAVGERLKAEGLGSNAKPVNASYKFGGTRKAHRRARKTRKN